MASIFLSHSHKDREFVQRLAADLRRCGVTVWVDQAELKVGDHFEDTLQKAVAEQDFLGVVLSRNSAASSWVKQEIELALRDEAGGRRSKVLPILIDDYPLPTALSKKVYADFRASDRYFVELSRLLKPLGVEISEEDLAISLLASSGKVTHRSTRALLRERLKGVRWIKIPVASLGGAFLSAVGMKYVADAPLVVDGPLATASLMMESGLGPGMALVLAIWLLRSEDAGLGCIGPPVLFVMAIVLLGSIVFILGLPFFLFDLSVTLTSVGRLWVAAAVGAVTVGAVTGLVVLRERP